MNAHLSNLRSSAFSSQCVLLTGASGYVGALIAARLLADGLPMLVVPLRPPSTRDSFAERLQIELSALGLSWDEVSDRVRTVSWLGVDEIGNQGWAQALDSLHIDEIIHSAGCLDYFDLDALTAVNLNLTTWLTDLGAYWGVQRFTYVSTAYSAGYIDGQIAEALLPEPERDPTAYTKTKRQAEWIVANSGLPYLILRPSILIGEWSSGRYSGKRYGLYQQWMGLERLLSDRYHAAIHTVAPAEPLNLLHQDTFQQTFAYAHRWLPNGAICNLVSSDDAAPSMRELWDMWIAEVKPETVYYYPRFEDVNLKAIDIRQRAYLTFAQVNLEIGAHRWRFDRGWLQAMGEHGLIFHDATREGVARCQSRFIASSDTLTRYFERFSTQFPTTTTTCEISNEINQTIATA